jgi:hypothetical protein
MSRTTRNTSFNKCALRSPKTFNEKRQIDSFITDEESMEFTISKMNRILSRRSIPTHWDDIVCSSYYETDYDR